MYAPDGFVQLNDVFTVCSNLAYDRFPQQLKDGDPFEPLPDVRPELYQKLLFERFVDAHSREMWLFKLPDILLRASPEFFYRACLYVAPCPETQEDAALALAHINRESMIFLSRRFRVVAEGNEAISPYHGLADVIAELKPMDGAIVLWKPETWPIDVERSVWPFRDKEYFRGHPYSIHLLEKQKGQMDSERLSTLLPKCAQTEKTPLG